MRLPLLVCLSLLGTVASADRLIDIPTARKILYDDVRYEFRAQPVIGGDLEHFLGIGIGKAFELDLRDVQAAGEKPVGTFDFSYNYIAAIPDLTPGISLGVQDAANLTQDGRRAYLVTTFRNSMDQLPGNLYADISLGFQVGRVTSPFVGVSVPLGETISLLAEHSGYRLNAGVDFHPVKLISLRFIVRDQETLLSLSATGKF